MKRLIIISLLLCTAMAQGQRFEWAKGYDSGYEDAFIKGSVTDSLGNLYILGQIHWDSDWDTIWLMPYLSTVKTMVMVAKISPEGEMVWRKIYGSTSTPTFAMDIKALGDTGFAVMFTSATGSPRYDVFYWGDSVYRNVYHPRMSPYDTPGRRFDDVFLDVYLSFDFEGNITEEHLLERSFVDTDGNDVVYREYTNPDSLSVLYLDFLYGPTFDVDTDGNVYICYSQNFDAQVIMPSYLDYNGTVGAMRYWVDHRLVGESIFDRNTKSWYPVLLKFAPHLDTLLASRYLLQRNNSANGDYYLWTHIKIDRSTENLFVRVYVQSYSADILVIDSVQNLTIHKSTGSWAKSFFAITNKDLSPMKLIELRDSILDSSDHYLNTLFSDIAFDYDSNLIAISGNPGKKNGLFLYDDQILPLTNKNFVLLLNKDDYSLKSLCVVPTEGESGSFINQDYGNLCLKNNRVFYQEEYWKGIHLPDGYYSVPGTKSGLALVVWDYQGNLIDGGKYNTYATRHDVGPISLVDSTLYLINFLTANAAFGNNQVHVSNYKACVAKYVDTAFMTVYRPPLGGITSNEGGIEYTFYPNPVENMLQVDLDGGRILQATAVSVLGSRERLGFAGNTVDVSHLLPGVYIMELTTTNNTVNFKFIKQ